jgi:hypothetical protein
MERLEMGAAIAVVGAGIFQIHDMYTKHAGPLDDVRAALPGDAGVSAQLTDADVLVGSTALIVGGAITLATGKIAPLILSIVGYLLVAGYYHAAFSNIPATPTETSNDD